MSTFGRIFRVTTFGESHCRGVGCIIDGCPPLVALTESDIQAQLTRRRPGQSKLATPRDEEDLVVIQSGTENGFTLGTPISLFVANKNIRPADYAEMRKVPRPGHADYTYQAKYGVRSTSGGGRSSARETIGRVAAGAVAEKWLKEKFGIQIVSWVSRIGSIDMPRNATGGTTASPWTREQVDRLGRLEILRDPAKWRHLAVADQPDEKIREKQQIDLDRAYDIWLWDSLEAGNVPAYLDQLGVIYDRNGLVIEDPDSIFIPSWRTGDLVEVRCPHTPSAARMASEIRRVKSADDSIGGIVTCVATGVPAGLGEPCFDKLPAMLAHAILSLPATKGFEIGSGFEGTRMLGSEHNDLFVPFLPGSGRLETSTNHAGGTLGGISSGAAIDFRVAIKPVSTIGRAQLTAAYDGTMTVLEAKGRHDPCVLPRAPPLIEAMTALVLADAALLQAARVAASAPTGTLPISFLDDCESIED